MLNQNELDIAVGARLRLLMAHLGMDQKQFGLVLDASQATISRMLAGTGSITAWMLYVLRESYQISEDWLLRGEGDMEALSSTSLTIAEIEQYARTSLSMQTLVKLLADKVAGNESE